MWLLSHCLELGEPLATHLTVPQPFQQYGVAYGFEDLGDSPDPSTFPAL